MPSVESAKLLFIQLPQQDTQGESAADNVPFSSARLLAYAEERGALKRDTATILDQDALDFGGDAAICSAAVRGLPELIIFHLETWNLDRSVWMARRLRALMPATHIAAFGPAAAESAELLKEQAFDALVEGEAESAFLELLGDLGHRVIKPRYRGTPMELEKLPDPYRCGILPIRPEKPVIFEASRGGAHALPYRYYPWKQGPERPAPKDAGPKLLKFAAAKGAANFMIQGDVFSLAANRLSVIKGYAAANETGINLRAELKLDAVNDEEARLWADASLAIADVPLPSLHADTLSALNLNVDRDAFERAARLFWSQGIGVRPELILGLPHESYDSVIDGFDALGMMGIGQDTDIKPLSLVPGCDLRNEAKRHGLREFLERPPYWIVETDWMTEDDLVDAIADFEDSFDVALAPAVKPCFSPLRGGFTSFADLRAAGALDALLVSPERLASSVTLLLRADDDEGIKRLARAAKDLRKENPYCLWQLVLYSDSRLLDEKQADRLADAFSMTEHYFELCHLYSLDPQPSFQTRVFFCTSSEALALQAMREQPSLETVLALGSTLPGPKLLELKPFLAFDKDLTPFELLYDVLSAYREFPELLVEAPGSLF